MEIKRTFNEVKAKHFPTLEQYVPIVAKVHGGHCPEFHEVHALFDAIREKTTASEAASLELSEEFAKLREVTNNYTVPSDVCESYEAVYRMLAELDQAYHV